MQVLQPPSTTSYINQEGHFIKTFLISTKFNEAGWGISKETGHKKVQSFIGKPFVIIPDNISSERQKGHIFANSRDQLLEEYKKHTHGIIESVSSPYFYGDGTDDYFYMANIRLNDSKAASALLEHGSKTWVPFAVSPHIWHINGPENNIDDWEGISLSLVPKGAYGQEAVINKYCKGDKPSCDRSLAASKGLCNEEDSKAASFINSSLLSQNENKDIMAQVVEYPQVKPVSNTQEPVQATQQQEPKKEVDNSKIEELEALKKQLEQVQKEKQEKEDTVTKLLNKDKTNTLTKIFGNVEDESIRKTLIDKYLPQDTDILNDFYQDVNTHVFPALVEAAKAQAENELKSKTIEENKSKSKAASSLPKEPVVNDNNKAAGNIVPNRVNQVKQFDRLMRGFS